MKKKFKNKYILVTGAAGFIGYHLVDRLLKENYYVLGIDNLNEYYDVDLKYSRLFNLGFNARKLKKYAAIVESEKFIDRLIFVKMNLEDISLKKIFEDFEIDLVINLAAQAGVRYSIKNPKTYIESNILGFQNLIQNCVENKIKKLIYASSSSVYGNNKKHPLCESYAVDKPISLYAASKKTNELIAHAYSSIYEIETIGLRLFTVYGPWGRPDMALYLFTQAIISGNKIDVYNEGKCNRDFTYIDDIISGILNIIRSKSKFKENYRIYNMGSGKSVNLFDFIKIIEDKLKIVAQKNILKKQPGDVDKTWASTKKIELDYGYSSKYDIYYGVDKFIEWYKKYKNYE